MSRIIRAIERRDSISNPSKWLTLAFGGGTDTATGIKVNEVVALRNLTVMSCVNVIAQTLAQLPLLIYAKTSDGGRKRLDDHPLYRILDKQPNDRMTAFTLREVLQSHLLTWGNAYAYIERSNAGEVIGLYPLLPDRTRPQLDANGNLVYLTRIKSDPNGISPNDNKQITLLPEDVLHIPGLGFDGLKGYSVVAQARESIGLGLALTEFAARFFGNGAIPGMVLQTDKSLSPEQRTMLNAAWSEGHQGLMNAQRIAILESGLKVEKIGIPPEDAQFLESRKFSRNELAGIYRVPPHMIGDVERSTSWGSGIEQQAIGFLVYTMLPWLERWQQAINIKLFKRSEQDVMYCEFLPDALLRGDTQTRYAAYGMAFGKWMTGNQIAARENLPPLGPAGDQLYVPSGMLPLDENGDPQMPAPSAQPPAPVDQNEPSALASAPAFNVRDSRKQLARAHRAAIKDIADRILRRERADLVREAERGQLSDEALASFYADHRQYVERQILPALSTYAESVRLLVEHELGTSISETRQFTQFVRSYAEAFAKRYCDTSLAELDGDHSALALERTFGPSVRRAERIAAFEAARAGNAFARALYREAGIPKVRWLLGDEREDCRVLADKTVPIGESFEGGIGHPPKDDGCACVLAAAEFTRNATPVEQPKDGFILAIEALAASRPTINVNTPPVTFTVADGAFRTEVTVPERAVNISSPVTVPERSVTVNSPTTIAEGAMRSEVTVPERTVTVAPPAVQVDVHVPEEGDKEMTMTYDKSGKVLGNVTRRLKKK